MMCYKDTTFCEFYDECSDGKLCEFALTEKVIEDAKKWWSDENAPVCAYGDRPECFKKY